MTKKKTRWLLKSLFLGTIVIGLITGCEYISRTNVTVEGIAVKHENGEPLANAHIMLYYANILLSGYEGEEELLDETYTDENGEFVLEKKIRTARCSDSIWINTYYDDTEHSGEMRFENTYPSIKCGKNVNIELRFELYEWD